MPITILPFERRASQQAIFNQIQTSNAAYVQLEGDQLALTEMQTQITVQLQAQNQQNSPHVILDECDRAQPDAFLPALHWLLARHKHIWLAGRHLPDNIHEDEVLSAVTDYAKTQTKTTAPKLDVRGFGRGQILFNGQPVMKPQSQQSQHLLFYLIDAGQSRAITDIIRDNWQDEHGNANSFMALKSYINQTMGYAIIESDKTSPRRYQINQAIEIHYDVKQFDDLLYESMTATDEAALLQAAMLLYRAPFLMHLESSWVIQRRQMLEGHFVDVLQRLACIAYMRGDHERAISLYLRATRLAAAREDIAAMLMQIYNENHMPQNSLQIYQRLRQALKKTVNLEPMPHLNALAQQAEQMLH